VLETMHLQNQHLLDLMANIAKSATEVEFAQCIKLIAASFNFEEFEYVLSIKKPLIKKLEWRLRGQVNEWVINKASIHHFINEPTVNYKINTKEKIYNLPSSDCCIESAGQQDLKKNREQVLIQEYDDSNGGDSVFKLKRYATSGEEGHDLSDIQIRLKVLAAFLHVSGIRTIGTKLLANERPKLTRRELECLNWCARGKTAYEISKILNISEPTAVFHLGNIVKKMNVNNRINAIAKGVALGLVA